MERWCFRNVRARNTETITVRQNAINKGSRESDFTRGAAEDTAEIAIIRTNIDLCVSECSRGLFI